MSTLEDKIFGEKKEYYCSSSESEDDQQSDNEEFTKNIEVDNSAPPYNPSFGEGSTNTGPKGVISDYQKFKQIEAEQRREREKERLALINKLSFTCKNEQNDEKEDEELLNLLDDPFLLEYSKQRMEEMLEKVSRSPKFGTVLSLSSKEEFLDAIDKENKDVNVVVHIYDNKVADCKSMNSFLNSISKEYPEVKFCKLSARVAGLSKYFEVCGVPALLVYKAGNLVGNFVRLTDNLGNDFTANDVESFLIENGILLDKSCIPSIIRNTTYNVDDE